METSFTVAVNMTEFGGVKEFLIAPKARYFEVFSEGRMVSSISKLKGDTWIQIDGIYPIEVVEKIGEGIDNMQEYSA
jgi:hypothetical protein